MRIRIERKPAGSSLWMVGVVAVALFAWWGVHRLDESVGTSAPPKILGPLRLPPVVAMTAPTLTELDAVLANPASFVGRSVKLLDVPVQAKSEDSTFWVGASESQRLFVILEPGGTSAAAENAKWESIDTGRSVMLVGTVREVPRDLSALQRRWQLSDATVRALGAQRVYLSAPRVALAQTS